METISTRSKLGRTNGDHVAEVVVRFHPSSTPGRPLGGYTITQTIDVRLTQNAGSEVSWVRHAISALLDDLEGITTRE